MTVSITQSTITIPGNGVQTVFNYPFEIPYQDDGITPAVTVIITINGATTILTPSEYTITGVGYYLGGTVTYSSSVLQVGSSITISRNKALTQPSSFPNIGFFPESVEEALDTIVLEMQQLTTVIEGNANPITFPPMAAAPSAPTLGQVYYDTTLGYPRIYGLSGWVGILLSS